jgi:hypothetical protein
MFIGIGSVDGAVAVRATPEIGARLVFLARLKGLDLLAGESGEVLGDPRISNQARANDQLVKLVVDGVT